MNTRWCCEKNNFNFYISAKSLCFLFLFQIVFICTSNANDFPGIQLKITDNITSPTDPNKINPIADFKKNNFYFNLLTKYIFDLDATIYDFGIKVEFCQVQSADRPAYKGLGNCLFYVLSERLNNNKDYLIYAWVRDNKGKILSPLVLSWKTSQPSWHKFAYEFIFLSYEDLLKFFVGDKNNYTKIKDICISENHYQLSENGQKKRIDLGNFIGDIKISTFDKNHSFESYFRNDPTISVPLILQSKNEIDLNAVQSGYINKKKMYDLKGKISAYSISSGKVKNITEITLRTNYNLVLSRNFCIKGRLIYNNEFDIEFETNTSPKSFDDFSLDLKMTTRFKPKLSMVKK